jgi:hypothetical protein
MNEQLLDSLPVAGVFVVFAIITLICYEVGFRVGRWWQDRMPGEQEGPTDMLVGSLLALMAFVLAITMGMAADRFDARRGLVLDEANSIGTTYLRAGYLPEPSSGAIRQLLREYAPLRVNVADRAQLEANFDRSAEILEQLWAEAELLAEGAPESETLGLFIQSLNQTIDLHATRVTAIVYARVPATVLLLLIIGAVLAVGMVGFNAGLSRKRSMIGAIALIVILGAVITLIVDLDRPRDGFLQVSQQPLIDLQEQIGPP